MKPSYQFQERVSYEHRVDLAMRVSLIANDLTKFSPQPLKEMGQLGGFNIILSKQALFPKLLQYST